MKGILVFLIFCFSISLIGMEIPISSVELKKIRSLKSRLIGIIDIQEIYKKLRICSCGIKFKSYKALKKHIKKTYKDQAGRFKCKHCEGPKQYITKYLKLFILHMLEYSKEAICICSECGKLITLGYFSRHKKLHQNNLQAFELLKKYKAINDETAICPICKTNFARFGDLIHHITDSHQDAIAHFDISKIQIPKRIKLTPYQILVINLGLDERAASNILEKHDSLEEMKSDYDNSSEEIEIEEEVSQKAMPQIDLTVDESRNDVIEDDISNESNLRSTITSNENQGPKKFTKRTIIIDYESKEIKHIENILTSKDINPSNIFIKLRECVCGEELNSYKEFIDHVTNEFYSNEQFRCKKCEFSTPESKLFIIHMLKYTDETIKLCSECLRLIPKVTFYRHKPLHKKNYKVFEILAQTKSLKFDEDSLICPFCKGKQCKTLGGLCNHINSLHTNEIRDIGVSGPIKEPVLLKIKPFVTIALSCKEMEPNFSLDNSLDAVDKEQEFTKNLTQTKTQKFQLEQPQREIISLLEDDISPIIQPLNNNPVVQMQRPHIIQANQNFQEPQIASEESSYEILGNWGDEIQGMIENPPERQKRKRGQKKKIQNKQSIEKRKRGRKKKIHSDEEPEEIIDLRESESISESTIPMTSLMQRNLPLNTGNNLVFELPRITPNQDSRQIEYRNTINNNARTHLNKLDEAIKRLNENKEN